MLNAHLFCGQDAINEDLLVLSLDTWSDQYTGIAVYNSVEAEAHHEDGNPPTTVLNFGIFNGTKTNANFRSPHSLFTVFRDFGAYKSSLSNLYNSLFRLQSSSLSPSSSESSICRLSGNHFRRLSWFQKTINGFDCKVNGRALGAELWHSLGVSDGRALAFPNRLQMLLAVTGLQTVRLLRVTDSCNTDLVLESKRF